MFDRLLLSEIEIRNIFTKILDEYDEVEETVKKRSVLAADQKEWLKEEINNPIIEYQAHLATIVGLLTLYEDAEERRFTQLLFDKCSTDKTTVSECIKTFKRYMPYVTDKAKELVKLIDSKESPEDADKVAAGRCRVNNKRNLAVIVSRVFSPALALAVANLNRVSKFDVEIVDSQRKIAMVKKGVSVSNESLDELQTFLLKHEGLAAGDFHIRGYVDQVDGELDIMDNFDMIVSNTYIGGVHFYRIGVQRSHNDVSRALLKDFSDRMTEYMRFPKTVLDWPLDKRIKLATYCKAAFKLSKHQHITIENREAITNFYFKINGNGTEHSPYLSYSEPLYLLNAMRKHFI